VGSKLPDATFFSSATDTLSRKKEDNAYSMKTSFPHELDWALQRNLKKAAEDSMQTC
jgi:hypothetical protein